MIRNEADDIPTPNEIDKSKWKGRRNFEDISIESNTLRYRRNATNQ